MQCDSEFLDCLCVETVANKCRHLRPQMSLCSFQAFTSNKLAEHACRFSVTPRFIFTARHIHTHSSTAGLAYGHLCGSAHFHLSDFSQMVQLSGRSPSRLQVGVFPTDFHANITSSPFPPETSQNSAA